MSTEPKYFLLDVRVQPRSSSRKLKVDDGHVKAYLHSPPEGNKANTELLELLAGALCIPKSNLELVRGHRSRTKTVRISGLTSEKALDLISAVSGW